MACCTSKIISETNGYTVLWFKKLNVMEIVFCQVLFSLAVYEYEGNPTVQICE